jgi:hypothetical protein
MKSEKQQVYVKAVYSHWIRTPWKRIREGILQTCVVIAVFLSGLLFGKQTLATTFRAWDDEGYVLLSLSHYLGGGHLYTEVFSQYGPFYFFSQKALFRLLHLPISHDAGRVVTLICWLLSATLGGYFVYRLAKNTLLASAAGLASMLLAKVLADEPGHPQQLVLPMLMLACCASVTPGWMGLLTLGALGTGLIFTKINIGVFYFAAVVLTLVCGLPAGRIRTIGAVFLLVYAAGCPLILMHRDLLGWAGGYCLLAILCGVSTFLAGLLATPPSPKPLRSVLYVALGAGSAALFIVVATLRQGMSLRTLTDGVLWIPLRHPGVFEVHLNITKRTVLLVALVSACMAWVYRTRDRWQGGSDWVDALRCVIGLYTIVLFRTGVQHRFFLLLAFLPLGLIPPKGRPWGPSDYFPRLFVTSLAVTQFLEAYPVAGSQVNIAAAPLLLWAFVCVHDGAVGLFRLAPRARDWFGDTFLKESVLGGFVALALAVTMFRANAGRKHGSGPSSSLRGSASLHLPTGTEKLYGFLANNIRANCDVLFTLPGMGSFNFWSGVPTPNGFNLTAWMKGLSLGQQQQILQILQKDPRACAVYSPELTRFWETTPEDLAALPLARYVLNDMHIVSQRQGYEIRVSPERNSPWVEVDTPASP